MNWSRAPEVGFWHARNLFALLVSGFVAAANAQEFDPGKIYDKLDCSRYRLENPTADTFYHVGGQLVITGVVSQLGSTNSIRSHDGQRVIESHEVSLGDAIDIYHTLGGTNVFEAVYTGFVTHLSLRTGPVGVWRGPGDDIGE